MTLRLSIIIGKGFRVVCFVLFNFVNRNDKEIKYVVSCRLRSALLGLLGIVDDLSVKGLNLDKEEPV